MKIILVFLIAHALYADLKEEMVNLYQNKKFEIVCNLGFENFNTYRDDEEFVSLYAFACLHSDYIDRLSIPIAMLKFSKEARANSAYFSVIFMQKKLLLHALIDNYPLYDLSLPTTDYVLSKVFDLYAKLGEHEARKFYLFEDQNDKKLTYKLYLEEDERLSKIIIEEFYDSVNIKRHVYW